jgi:hypothetical protein
MLSSNVVPTATSTARLRDELNWLRARHDSGAIASSVYHLIKRLESELAWREHIKLLRRVMSSQVLLFPELAPPSSSVVGLEIILTHSCDCGECIAIVGSCGPHHASLICPRCGVHRGWLPGETYRFINTIIDTFGRPTEPIVVTTNSRARVDDQQLQTELKRKTPMHIDQLYPSRFLRCADLNGQPTRVVIKGISREDVGGEQKNVLSFANGAKSLILNKTNARAIAKALGCDDTKDWRGKSITLVPAVTDFKGDTVDCIRIRPAKPQAEEEPPFEDDMNDGLEDLIGPGRTA